MDYYALFCCDPFALFKIELPTTKIKQKDLLVHRILLSLHGYL